MIAEATGPILFTPISAGVGESTVVAAVAGSRIRPLGIVVTGVGGVRATATFQSGTGGGASALSGACEVDPRLVFPYCPAGWFQTVAGEALSVLTTLVGIEGSLCYQLVG